MTNLADGYLAILEAAMRGARPDPELHVDEWSEEFMVLPKDAAKPGRYRIEHTPMARRILQVLSPRHPARRVVVKGASQMLKTQVAINWLMASAHRAPGNMLVLEPTDQLAKRLSARVQKVIRDVPALQTVFAPPRSRDSRNTVFAKDFEGGTMYIATAGSAANLAEIPARYWYVDEASRLALSVDGEGDPIALAEARATTFDSNSKGLITSSPGEAGADVTDEQFDRGTQEVYLVPCPHCDHHHELLIENFRYTRDPDSKLVVRAWFVCPECGAEIEERDKARMLRDEVLGGTAHWQAKSEGDGETVSFHVSAFYAPVGSVTWLKLARQHAHAKEAHERGNPNAMQAFYNTRLALSWANDRETTSAQELMARADIVPRVVPDWALVVTIDVDTQANRLEVQAHAWGPGMQHAVIDYHVIDGSPSADPADPSSCWARLDEYRRTPFAHESGPLILASITGIDSGGLNTQDVYNYGRTRERQGVLVHHGSARPDRPILNAQPSAIDIDWRGRRIKEGVKLWTIGTDVAKDHLHSRMKLSAGHGAMRFSTALPLTWYEGLLSEVRRLKRRAGGGYRRVWEKTSHADRNEPLDLAVGNLALAYRLRLHTFSAADWARLRAKHVPQKDLFIAAPPAAPRELPSAESLAAAPASPAAEVPVKASEPAQAVDAWSEMVKAPRRSWRVYNKGIGR